MSTCSLRIIGEEGETQRPTKVVNNSSRLPVEQPLLFFNSRTAQLTVLNVGLYLTPDAKPRVQLEHLAR